MSSKVLYTAVAVIGIGAASYGAWWYQHRAPQSGTEVAATGTPSAAGATTGGTAGRSAAGSATSPAGSASGAGGPRAAAVEVAKVERAELRDDAQSVGTLRSRQSIVLRPEVAGRVAAIGFVDGAQVRRGQVLVQLDDVLQRAELRQAQAQVSIAQANFKRNQELVAQNFVAQRVLDESAANLQVAEAQLALACARLERMRIVAPFDATVGIRNVNLGDFVKDGADLINLEDIASMYVDFRLPERFQSKLRVGQEVELQIDALPGRLFKARVQALDPLIDANGRSVGVRATLPNSPGEPLAQGGRGGAPGSGAPAGAAASAASGGARGGPGAAAAGAGVRVGAAGSGGPRAGRGPIGAASAPAAPAGADGSSARDPLLAACPAPVRPAGADAIAADGPPAAGRRGDGGVSAAGGGGRGGPLRPGMFARVNAVFAVRENALVIPEEAIVPQGGRQFVVRVVEPSAVPGTATASLSPDVKDVSQRVEVKLGIRRPGRVEVTDGLAEGMVVVTAGQQRLQRDGTPVRVVELGRGGPGGGSPGPRGGGAPGGGPAGAGASAPADAGAPGGAGAAAPAAAAASR